MIEVSHAAELPFLPDGSIIEWLRIEGDPTSTAVAYIHTEIETQTDADGRTIAQGPVTWISPGGWQPMTIEEAGLTYPVRVVRLGEFDPAQYPSTFAPMISGTLEHGGTWSREKALECASRFLAGTMAPLNAVLGTADAFEEWLDREVVPEPSADCGLGHATD